MLHYIIVGPFINLHSLITLPCGYYRFMGNLQFRGISIGSVIQTV